MGDLEFGYEEMQGVKLGYLVIQGKQMFALSQVFTDLLKNIPRTTVHKRMDHLNVKKHHCDLEELRKLKAINSVAFHAAKCTLISKEDVEALYLSCKTERVLKSNKKRTRAKPDKHIRDDVCSTETGNGFWKEKLWLSFRGVSPELSSNLPQIYSKTLYQNFPALTPTACRAFKNYETVQVPGKCVEFNEKLAFFRSGEFVKKKPVVSAISAPSDSELLYKRKRRSERHFGSRKRRCRQVVFVPKCCKPKACLSNRSLSHFHADREFCLQRTVQESCSSDTECSSANDSDFGSSLSAASSSTSSSSNSESSEDDEEDSLSCSSEESSDDAESSSQSDSSSVSSRVSVQSIRFRRARFTNHNAKAPLVLQPTFHYRSNFHYKNGVVHGGAATALGDCEKEIGIQTFDSTGWRHRYKNNDVWDGGRKLSPVGNGFSGLNKVEPKSPELMNSTDKDLSFTSCANVVVLHQQGASEQQALFAQLEQDKEPGISNQLESKFSEGANSKKEIKTVLKQSSPLKQVKTEIEDTLADPDINHVTSLNHVKIKVEDTFDEYEYATQGHAHRCNGKYYTSHDGDGLPISADDRAIADRCKDGRNATPSPKQEPLSSTLTGQGEYRNGARVRKSYRTPIWGKKTIASVSKVDRSPRPAGKCAGKRATNQATSSKSTFSFMANFPCPPSLMIGSDGDLIPAYSLKSFRTNQVPHPSHPVWRWQLGTSVVPSHLNQSFRKTVH